jgi:CHAD domain-containing protein
MSTRTPAAGDQEQDGLETKAEAGGVDHDVPSSSGAGVVAPADPAAQAIQTTLAEGLERLRASLAPACRGEVEGVHRLRTTSRRLRSALRAFEGLVEPHWAGRLEVELKWIAGLLGAVRDLDVLKERLRCAAGESVEALEPLFASLTERHARASETLRAALQGERYQRLVESLAEAAGHPAFCDDAWEPCRTVLPRTVAGAWSRLKKCGRSLTPDDPDDDYHAVRKRAKRVRYAAEAVADPLGPDQAKEARRFARRATDVQDILGEHQDAIVACQEINRLVADRPHDGPFNLAAGRLLERQEHAARAARAQFFEVWDRLDRKKMVRWLKG